MVYLASVKNDDEVFDPKSHAVESIPAPQLDEDDFYTNVYGSHFSADHLPQHEMPEREMPRQIAARMIKDELSLDGNPKLK
jgi:glutamate decarboxylase